MDSKHNSGKNPIGLNQPPSRELKDPTTTSKKSFGVPFDFIASQYTRRYPPKIPTQPTPYPSYTHSPNTPNPHQDSSSNKGLRGVTLEEPLYHIPNTEVDQLHHHIWAYLKSIPQIPIIYQIPRSRASQRRTQPYGDDETLISNIDDLIINTIFDIRQPITTIAQSEISKDPQF